MVTAIVGANWGDEGKGKMTDMLAQDSDIIIRFQGGANAGHTIVNNYGKFALHTLPSGVFYSHTTSIIGNGVALNIPLLIGEINGLVEKGVPKPHILVSDRAQVVMPYHILFDEYEEERLAGKSFGSTKSGIAPFYSDKYAKIGFQVSELFDDELLEEKVPRVLVQKNVLLRELYHKPEIQVEDVLKTLREYRDLIAPYVCDVSLYLDEALKAGKKILLEGQLGTMKDTDHGIYPMVTSSSTLAAYGAVGAGIPPRRAADALPVAAVVVGQRAPEGRLDRSAQQLSAVLFEAVESAGAVGERRRQCPAGEIQRAVLLPDRHALAAFHAAALPGALHLPEQLQPHRSGI